MLCFEWFHTILFLSKKLSAAQGLDLYTTMLYFMSINSLCLLPLILYCDYRLHFDDFMGVPKCNVVFATQL